jgi:hypothetical protein
MLQKLQKLAREYRKAHPNTSGVAQGVDLISFKLALMTAHTQTDLRPLIETIVIALKHGYKPEILASVLQDALGKKKF